MYDDLILVCSLESIVMATLEHFGVLGFGSASAVVFAGAFLIMFITKERSQ